MHIYKATVEDMGTKDGALTIGLYLSEESAIKAVINFNPQISVYCEECTDEYLGMEIVGSSDIVNVSGAIHVIHYKGKNSSWEGFVVKFEVRQ